MARSVDDLLAAARARIERVTVSEMIAAVQSGALVVDTRTEEQRRRDGDMPFAIVVDRTVFEWRLAPTSPSRIPEAEAREQIIVVCNEGFSSSLAAANLAELGVPRPADLIGGFQAWLAEGSPLPPSMT